MDQGFEVHSEKDFDFVRENQLLNHAFTKSGVCDSISDIEGLIRRVSANGLGVGVDLLHPFDLDWDRLFDFGFARCARGGSRRAARRGHGAGLLDAFFGFVIVFALAGSANDSSRNSSHHGHDGVAEVHFATGAVTDKFFSNGKGMA